MTSPSQFCWTITTLLDVFAKTNVLKGVVWQGSTSMNINATPPHKCANGKLSPFPVQSA